MMENINRKKWLEIGRWTILCAILILSLVGARQATADSGEDPKPVTTPVSNPQKDPGLKRINAAEISSPMDISTPDAYGYTWDNGQPYSWTDVASSGNNAGLDDIDDGFSTAKNLGFDFPFYEGVYDQVFISSNGFLTFEKGSTNGKNSRIPFIDEPNAMIAPFWDDLEVGRRNEGNVYYQGFSDHFIVSYDEIASRSTYTQTISFQVVLYDTGDICFRYKELNGELTSATVGIEDRDGVTGLPYLYNAPGLQDLEGANSLCFIRPTDHYLVKVLPEYQGGFVGENNEYEVEVINTGSLGPDTFDLEIQQTNLDWQIELYDQFGNLITKDSNSNGKVETPVLGEGDKFIVVVKFTAPETAEAGSFTSLNLIVRSLEDGNQTRTAKLQTAVPASFVQSLTTRVRIDLRMVTAEDTKVKTIFPLFTGSTLGVQQFSTYNYMVFWERNGQKFDPDIALFTDIEHAVANDLGILTLAAVKTTSNNDAVTSDMWIYDSNPVSVEAPNGRVALVWVRDLIDRSDPSDSKTNSNVYLVILDQADTRNVISGPINITNNSSWDSSGDLNVPRYFTPHISATTDNRFFVVWTDERVLVQGATISNIGLAAYTSGGMNLVPAQKYDQLDSTVGNGLLYQDPAVYGLLDGRVFLAFSEEDTSEFHTGYAILEANGTTYLAPQFLSSVRGRYPIPRQLNSGPIVLTMTGTAQEEIAFSMISGTTYQPGSVTTLSTPDNLAGDYVSVTEGVNGNAVLTWLDTDLERMLYYALIGPDGNIITPPMTFYVADVENSIAISESGRGNAPYDPRMGVFLPCISNSE